MLGWFRALMPKEERFFDLFTRHARITLAAAEALRALLKGDDDVLRCCKEITRRENEADEITREVMTALRKTFITPLDRGDIKDLITSMDDSIDQALAPEPTARQHHCRSDPEGQAAEHRPERDTQAESHRLDLVRAELGHDLKVDRW